jgi:hypothetical protein
MRIAVKKGLFLVPYLVKIHHKDFSPEKVKETQTPIAIGSRELYLRPADPPKILVGRSNYNHQLSSIAFWLCLFGCCITVRTTHMSIMHYMPAVYAPKRNSKIPLLHHIGTDANTGVHLFSFPPFLFILLLLAS